MNDAGSPSPWLTIDQACAYVQLGRKVLYRAVKRGTLRAAVVDQRRALRFRREWLDAFLESSAPQPISVLPRRDRGGAA